ncbi:uncharacterized protein LOC144621713 [Crassostrea virginica]
MYDRQIFILISFLAGGLCLECYRCYYASDPSLCRHHVTCASGQSCSQKRLLDSTGVHYDLDCIDTTKECKTTNNHSITLIVCIPCCFVLLSYQACHRSDRTDLPNILGKRAQSLDIFCCDTDLCHTDSTTSVTNVTTSAVLTSSTEPSTVAEVKTTLMSNACVDHPDCDVLMNDFDACNDTYVAMTVCRKSCKVCDVTTNAPSCFDVHQDCEILSEHLNVCENENFARTRCAQTCGVCGSTTPSWTYTTTTESTNSSENANTTEPVDPTYTTNPTIAVTTEAPDLCEDRKDCVLLREINVCSSPLTAQLCPEYCGLCLNGSLTDNATFATMQPSIPTTFNKTTIVSTTDSEIYGTSTKNSKILFLFVTSPLIAMCLYCKDKPFLSFCCLCFRTPGHDNTNNKNIFRLEFILRKGLFIKETRCLRMKNIVI